MNIRRGGTDEVQGFDLWSSENQGSTITVVEDDGRVVAFAQHDGTTIYMVESAEAGKGYARALVEHIIDGADYAAADNVGAGCAGFWSRLGFEPEAKNAFGQPVWTWYPEEA